MAATVEMFRARFPEFSDPEEFSSLRIELFLEDAVVIYMGIRENRWCNKYNIAQMYLAAHLLYSATSSELGDTSSKSGPISSKSAGGVSVSRAVVAKDRSDQDGFLSGTSYGQQFIIIRNSCFVGVAVANLL